VYIKAYVAIWPLDHKESSLSRICVCERERQREAQCMCAYIHVTLENQKWHFLGPRFLEIQKIYIYIYIYGNRNTGFVSFVAMKAFWGTASMASLILKFGTRCCGVVNCPLELSRKNLLFPLYRRRRTLHIRCVRNFSEYPAKVCWENDLTWGKKCVSNLCGVLFFCHWHVLVNYNKHINWQFHMQQRMEDAAKTSNYVTLYYKGEDYLNNDCRVRLSFCVL
jgi:hypothetical protein